MRDGSVHARPRTEQLLLHGLNRINGLSASGRPGDIAAALVDEVHLSCGLPVVGAMLEGDDYVVRAVDVPRRDALLGFRVSGQAVASILPSDATTGTLVLVPPSKEQRALEFGPFETSFPLGWPESGTMVVRVRGATPIGELPPVLLFVESATAEPIEPEVTEAVRALAAAASDGLARAALSGEVDRLRALNDAKDEFVANVSHELRTPLAAIIGSVATASGLGEMIGPDERRDLLVSAERQAKRLAELLENLLADSRLRGDDPSLVVSRVHVDDLVEEVAGAVRSKYPGRQVDESAAPNEIVLTDRTLLYRILINLVDNAVKYSDGGVAINADRDGDGVRIDVVDRGPGLSDDELGRIFDRFHRATGSDRAPGAGIGLDLVRRGTTALRGRIDVASEPGRGSTFSLWVPRAFRGPRTHTPPPGAKNRPEEAAIRVSHEIKGPHGRPTSSAAASHAGRDHLPHPAGDRG